MGTVYGETFFRIVPITLRSLHSSRRKPPSGSGTDDRFEKISNASLNTLPPDRKAQSRYTPQDVVRK
jgi:hypothetical protein